MAYTQHENQNDYLKMGHVAVRKTAFSYPSEILQEPLAAAKQTPSPTKMHP